MWPSKSLLPLKFSSDSTVGKEKFGMSILEKCIKGLEVLDQGKYQLYNLVNSWPSDDNYQYVIQI